MGTLNCVFLSHVGLIGQGHGLSVCRRPFNPYISGVSKLLRMDLQSLSWEQCTGEKKVLAIHDIVLSVDICLAVVAWQHSM